MRRQCLCIFSIFMMGWISIGSALAADKEIGITDRLSASVKYWYAYWHIHNPDGSTEDSTGTGLIGAQVRYQLGSDWTLAASVLYGEFNLDNGDVQRWDSEGIAAKSWRLENGSASFGLGWRLMDLHTPNDMNVWGVKDDIDESGKYSSDEWLEMAYGPVIYVGANQSLGEKWGIYGSFSLQPYLWMESTKRNDDPKDWGQGYNAEIGVTRKLENGHSVDLGYRGQNIRGNSTAVEHVNDWFHGVIASYNF